MRNIIQTLIGQGVHDQHELFRRLYPTWRGHYGRLRDLISEVKNDDANSRR